jgi:hypothetical protein
VIDRVYIYMLSLCDCGFSLLSLYEVFDAHISFKIQVSLRYAPQRLRMVHLILILIRKCEGKSWESPFLKLLPGYLDLSRKLNTTTIVIT